MRLTPNIPLCSALATYADAEADAAVEDTASADTAEEGPVEVPKAASIIGVSSCSRIGFLWLHQV